MAIKPVEILIKARDEASGIFTTMQGKVAAVGAAIVGYFGVSAFIGAVKGAADLEAKLSEVKAVSGATAAEMVLLRKAAEDAGASTKFTATEGADALGNLTRAGVSAKDAIAALPAVLQLAQAGGIGLAEASDYVSKTIMGMGLSFNDAGRVADVLAMGANASNTSVTGLAQAMSYAAPLAKTLGLGLETTVAIIGKFADAGIDASRAGTALNAIMSQFADPASRFRTELAGAGITTTNFEQALRQLAAAGPAGAKAITAVGTEAGPALRALLNQGIGALDDLKGKLDGAKGSAAATAAVMEDNLKGSFNSLSSAWDSLKNALMTPVLPVLKDGVTQLAAAFSGAVSDGTIGKFGDAIATAFQGGIKWVREFAAQVNFTELAARLQAFAAQTQDVFTKIGEYASNAGNIVKTVYGVMSAGTNAVLTGVYGIGIAFSEVAIGIVKVSLSMTEALQKIAFGSAKQRLQDEAAMMRTALAGLTGVSEEFGKKANSAFVAMGDGAEMARNGVVGLGTDTASAATQGGSSAAVFKTVATDLTAVGTAATDAGTKTKESGDKQQAAASATKEKVATLRAEYEAAVATGNWQLAAEKMTALDNAATAAKDGTADLRKKAEEDAAAIAASFERMGIKTKTEIKTTADVARQDFERIKASGQATSDGLSTSFKDYAEKAIAANGGVATAAIKAQGAMYGISIQTDATGKAIVKTMEDAAKSVKTVEDAYRQLGLKTPEELNKIAAANKRAWDMVSSDSNASLETLKKAFSTYAQSALDAAGNVGTEQRIVTEEVLKTEAAAKGLILTFDEAGRVTVKSQGDAAGAVDKTTKSIEAQNAALERTNALERERLKIDKEGFSTDKDGKRIVAGGDLNTLTGITSFLKNAGVADEAKARNIAREFADSQGNITYMDNPGQRKYGGDTLSMALLKAAETYTFGTGNTGTGQTPSTIPQPAKSYTVNVNLPGSSPTTINTSSDADAQALIALLQRAKLSA